MPRQPKKRQPEAPDNVQSAIFQIAEAAFFTQNLDELFREIHRIISGLMEARNFYIALVDPATGRLEAPYFVDEYDPQPSAGDLQGGMTEYVLRTGQPVLASPEVFAELVSRGEVESIGTPSIDWLGVPLITAAGLIGVLVVQSYREGVRYSEKDKQLLIFVSHQVAMAIERKRAEEALREKTDEQRTLLAALKQQRDFLRTLSDNIPDLIWAKGADGKYLFVNQAMCDVLLKCNSPDEAVGKTDLFFAERVRARGHRHDFGEMCIGTDQVIYDTRKPAKFDEYGHIQGEFTWLEVHKAPFYDTRGEMIGTVGCGRDITSRIRDREALAESEERYRMLVDNMPNPVIVYRDGKLIYANPALLGVSGYTLEELAGRSPLEFLGLEYRGRAAEMMTRRAQGENLGDYEVEAMTKSGERRHCIVRAAPIKFDGQPAVVTILLDITERKRAEDELRRTLALNKALLDAVPDLMFRIDREGHFRETKREGIPAQTFYVPPEQFLGKTVREILPPQVADQTMDVLAEVLQAGSLKSFEYSMELGGDKRYFEARLTPCGEDEVLVIVREITDRKLAEEALRQSEEKYRLLFEGSKDMIYISTLDGRLLDVNQAGVTLLGFSSKEEFCQAGVLGCYQHPADRRRFSAAIARDGFVKDFELPLKCKDGRPITVLLTADAIRDPAGEIAAYRGIIRDITERRRLEQQLFQVQKMESIGAMAGGIAHDFNNILGVILGYSSFMKTKLAPDHPFYNYVDSIERGAQRAADLTLQLLAFARGGRMDTKPVNINAIATETVQLIARTIDKNIEVRSRLTPGLPTVQADAAQIQQVFMNLFNNARDAMPEGGELLVETMRETISSKDLRVRTDAEPGEYLVVAVSDTGVGIDKENLERVFEPFFTTKEKGKGTGLGLAMVYGVVKNHRGFVRVYSEVGVGSTFRVYLPVSGEPEPIAALKDEKTHPLGSETLLVVDDEADIRDFIRDIFTEYGYQVLTASNGPEAIEMYRSRPGGIDLVILDMVMPRMDGRETFRRLREIDPGVRALLSSGYSQDGQAQKMMVEGVRGFLQKPFEVDLLLTTVRAVLGPRREN